MFLIEMLDLAAAVQQWADRLAAEILSGAAPAGWLESTVVALYLAVMVVLAGYGLHRYQLIRLYFRHRGRARPEPSAHFDTLPAVTVQLPIYNEQFVVEQLIESVCRLDYPRERLQIQVLDDSTDETRAVTQAAVARWAALGHPVEYIHRGHREGFKAGALENGLARARGELIAVFDADFEPSPDFLHQTVHYFTDPQVGMVQGRWTFRNREHSLLTRVQAVLLDGHFVFEHGARARSGRFFNFNGTAGVLRRTMIEDAGGWQHDTLTEDLDLSYRAQLAGWQFLYLPEIEVPGEIPIEINAFKSQQHRWTKGAVQTAKKVLPRIWHSALPTKVKVEATFHLTANICYIMMLLMALLTIPVLSIRSQLGWERLFIIDLPLFSFATMAISGFYITSQRVLYPDWRRQIKYLPLLMAIGMSLCINNTRAVIEGLVGYQTDFLRTPKYGLTGRRDQGQRRKYLSRWSLLSLGELGMALYFVVALYHAYATGLYLGMPFLLLFHAGFLYTGLLSSGQRWLHRVP
jgi:cellulose synthase/poly-beta-1,6-N-acetylglucosamine synthase-like glycosyltransferase